jgi:NTE family protein
VIRALEDAGVRISHIAGTSAGAVVGAFHAAGRLDFLEEFVSAFDWKRFLRLVDPSFPKSGLISGQKIEQFLMDELGVAGIEDLSVPFACVAANLADGREVVFDHGPLARALRASISVPGMFTPARANGMYLVDGGLVNPLPVDVARRIGPGPVAAVDLNHDIVENRGIRKFLDQNRPEPPATASSATDGAGADCPEPRSSLSTHVASMIGRPWTQRVPHPGLWDVLNASLVTMEKALTEARLAENPPDFLVRPGLGHIRFLEFHRAREAIQAGYEATRQMLASAGSA